MTSLFAKITVQMIANCKLQIIGEDSVDALWESDPQGEENTAIESVQVPACMIDLNTA